MRESGCERANVQERVCKKQLCENNCARIDGRVWLVRMTVEVIADISVIQIFFLRLDGFELETTKDRTFHILNQLNT